MGAAARKQVKELKHKIAKTDGEGFKAPSPNFNIHKAEASMSQAKGRMKKAILAQKRAKLYARKVEKRAAAHAKKEKELSKKDRLKIEELAEKGKLKAAEKVLKLRKKERDLQMATLQSSRKA